MQKKHRWQYIQMDRFLGKRTIQVRVSLELSDIKHIDMGTPQGNVLSPLFFFKMIPDFPEGIHIVASLYADDSALWKSSTNLAHIRDKLQEHLTDITKWCVAWGYKINI